MDIAISAGKHAQLRCGSRKPRERFFLREVVLHAPDSGPPPPPTNDAEALATKASGVSLHMGPEMALDDAEALLLKSKKEATARGETELARRSRGQER